MTTRYQKIGIILLCAHIGAHLSGLYKAVNEPRYTIMFEQSGVVSSISNVTIADECKSVKPNDSGSLVLYDYSRGKRFEIDSVNYCKVIISEKRMW